MRLLPRTRSGLREERFERRNGGLAGLISQMIRGQEPDGQVRVAQRCDQLGNRSATQIEFLLVWLPGASALVRDSPDAPAMLVAAGMVQVDLVVPDDAVVEIGNIQRAVRAQLHVHGTKPRVVAGYKIRL